VADSLEGKTIAVLAAVRPGELLTTYLKDAHAIELRALEQMRLAPRLAGNRIAGTWDATLATPVR
jgi:hypothetical protein